MSQYEAVDKQHVATDEPDDENTFDVETEGKAEAKRVLQAVDADTEHARAEAAVAYKHETVERRNRQLTDAKQRRHRTWERIEAFEYTIERLEAATDDQLVMQRLEGGISLSVPSDERDGVREDLREHKRRLEQQLEGIDTQIETIERGFETDRVALDHLQNHSDLVTEQ